MSLYFPTPSKTIDANGIEITSFNISNLYQTQIKLAKIPPKAKIDWHCHPESQVGLCVEGKFLINVNGKEQILEACKNAYVVAPNVYHSGENCFSETAIGLDIKSLNPPITHDDTNTFLTLVNQIELATGISISFFVGPWCEVMVSRIPKGAQMPVHKHKNEQFGVALKGKYMMQVGEEKQVFEYGQVYYSPDSTLHGAYNPFEEDAISLNIFLPPRYNKPVKHKQ